jgi:hypothetical protein
MGWNLSWLWPQRSASLPPPPKRRMAQIDGSPTPPPRGENRRPPKDLDELSDLFEEDEMFLLGLLVIIAVIKATQITVSSRSDEPRAKALAANLTMRLKQATETAIRKAFGRGRACHEIEFAFNERTGNHELMPPDYLELKQTSAIMGEDGIEGVAYEFEKRKIRVLGVGQFWWLSIDGGRKNPAGRSRWLGAPWRVYRKRRVQDQNYATWMKKFALGFGVMYAPSEYPSTNKNRMSPYADTNMDGTPADPMEHAQAALATVRGGDDLVLPADVYPDSTARMWEYKPPENKQDAGPLENRQKMLDAAALRSIGVPERSVTQDSDVGSNAMSQTHVQMLIMTASGIGKQMADSFQKQVVEYAEQINTPPGVDWGLEVIYPDVDPEVVVRVLDIIKSVVGSAQPSPLITSGVLDLGRMLTIAKLPTGDHIEQRMAKVVDQIAQERAAQQQQQMQGPNRPFPFALAGGSPPAGATHDWEEFAALAVKAARLAAANVESEDDVDGIENAAKRSLAMALLASRLAGIMSPWAPKRAAVGSIRFDLSEADAAADWPIIDKAIAWVKERDLLTDGQIERLRLLAEDEAAAASEQWAMSLRKRLADAAAESIEAGDGVFEWRKRASEIVDLANHQLEAIGRTATHNAMGEGLDEVLSNPDVAEQFPGAMFSSTNDARTRQSHRAMDGKVARVGSPLYQQMREMHNEWGCRCVVIPLSESDLQGKNIETDRLPYETKPARLSRGERKRLAKWSGPHTGPHGGHYWINSETGEKSYHEPGSSEHAKASDEREYNVDVEIPEDHREQVGRVLKQLGFEHPRDAVKVTGAPSGSRVTIKRVNSGLKTDDGEPIDHLSVRVVNKHDVGLKAMDRVIGIDKQGRKFIYNESLTVADASKGKGLEIFGQQVDHAVRAGFSYITADATREHGMNGYYTWARFGYDKPISMLDLGDAPLLPKNLRSAERISDLMMTQEGRDWWKKHGVTIPDARFDLTEGSLSRRVLDEYRKQKAAANAGAAAGTGGGGRKDSGRDMGHDAAATKQGVESLKAASGGKEYFLPKFWGHSEQEYDSPGQLIEKAPVQEIKLDKLIATQPYIETAKVKAMIESGVKAPAGGDRAGEDYPSLVKYRGKWYIHDGHHRVAAETFKGSETIRARLWDGDKNEPIQPKKQAARRSPPRFRLSQGAWSGPMRGSHGGTYWVNRFTGKKTYHDPRSAHPVLGRSAQTAKRAISKVAGGVGALEHKAVHAVAATVEKLPGPLQKVVRGGYAAATSTYSAGRAAVEKTAAAVGVSPDRAAQLGKSLTMFDYLLAKGAFAAAAALGAGPVGATAASFLPVASLGYLAFTTAKNPTKTLELARAGVKRARTALRLALPSTDAQWMLDAARAAAASNDEDGWLAAFSIALDETKGDARAAISLANAATENPDRSGASPG